MVWLRRHALSFLGVLLLLAAGLKMHGAAFDPVRPTGLLALPAVRFGIILIEIVLGLWFLSGLQRAQAWLVAIGIFTLFALVSARQGWIGEASCGCFGNVVVSPWLAFAIDLTALALLLMVKPSRADLVAALPTIRRFAPAALVGLFALVVATGYAIWAYGSLASTLAHLRGELVSIQPQIVDLGTAEIGEGRTARVDIVNFSPAEVFIFGGTSDCSCTVAEDLPVRIPSGEAKAIRVKVRMPGQPGQFTRRAKLMTDADGARTIQFHITGRSIEPERVADGR